MQNRFLNRPALSTATLLCCVTCYGISQSAFALKPTVAVPGKGNSPESIPLEDDLFQRLLGDDPVKEPEKIDADENPLKEAIQGMREAEQRMGNRDLGSETREIQRKVVNDLEKLIDLARQRQQQSQQRQQGRRSPNSQQQDASQQQQDRERSSPDGQNAPQQQNRSEPGDSAAGTRTDETRPADLLRQNQLVEEVWGHLPPALRERMQNVIGEKYLPSYDELIRRYFKSLAEERRSRTGK